MPTTRRQALLRLERLLGQSVVALDEDVCRAYGRDETEDLEFTPQAVARPRSVSDVCEVMRFASLEAIPVTPRGGGTGLSGGALPVHGGIVLSLERLNRIRSIDSENLVAEVEAGVVTGVLHRRLEERDLFYPPDPASHERCLIGGNVAEDSAGPRSCKYGSTRRWVLGLEAVLADGRMLTTGGANRKDVAGYNLTQLLVGSEGTLAVVTAATLRLIPQPAARITVALPFADLAIAATAVAEVFARGHDPAACELLDGTAIEAVARLESLPAAFLGLEALMLLELDGQSADDLLVRAATLTQDVTHLTSGEAALAVDQSDQRRLWRIRDRVGEAVKAVGIYKEVDTVVPRAELAVLVGVAREAAQEFGLDAVCYGHAGDGNLHVNLLRGTASEAEWEERRDAAEEQLFHRVVELGGSISGEHGIGWTQRRFLPIMKSSAELEMMRRVKTSFDPAGILNPGKIFAVDSP